MDRARHALGDWKPGPEAVLAEARLRPVRRVVQLPVVAGAYTSLGKDSHAQAHGWQASLVLATAPLEKLYVVMALYSYGVCSYGVYSYGR